MKIPRSVIANTVEVLLTTGARKATTFLDEQTIVRATNQWKPRKNQRSQTILLTLGKPNFHERAFIKSCKRTGGLLPMRRVQVKMWPK